MLTADPRRSLLTRSCTNVVTLVVIVTVALRFPSYVAANWPADVKIIWSGFNVGTCLAVAGRTLI